MRLLPSTLLFLATTIAAAPVAAQAIIAQMSGLTNADHVIDFGANVLPNFTPVSNQFPGLTITHACYFTTGVSNNLVGGFLTNDGSGAPNTLRIQFANPIHDLTFVYHQVGPALASAFRAMLGPTQVFSFSYASAQNQPNNYFGFTGITFDELQLDFIGDFNVDTLAFNDNGAACRARNGNNINPNDFTFSTRPVLGQNWMCQIATDPNTISTGILFAPGGASAPTPLLNGELLVQLAPAPALVHGPGSYSIPIPGDPSWLGFQVSTQGLRFQVVGPTVGLVFTNALDLRLGL